MSTPTGETTVPIGDWTTGTLKVYEDEKISLLEKYFEQRFIDQDKAVQAALLATKEAVLKAEAANEKRFEAVNEFRGQLADQTATLMPRAEADSRFNGQAEKISDLTDRINTSEGKDKGSDKTIAYAVTAVSIAIATVSLILSFNN